MKKKIKNISSKSIAAEIQEAIFSDDIDMANDLCEEYNLRVVEIEQLDDERIYTIGDRKYD